jgi:hypothetical protein
MLPEGKRPMPARVLFPALLIFSMTVAHAQTPSPTSAKPPAPAALTPQQKSLQAMVDKVGPPLIKVAAQVAELVDRNKTGEVWDHASGIAKAIVTRDIFISQVNAARASTGAVKSRKLDSVSSSVYNGQGTAGNGPIVPAGTYINVVFATQFANRAKTVHELVSFHLDPDRHWRVTGYTLH